MNSRRTPLIVGLVLAIGTGLLILNFLGQLHKAEPVAQNRTVVIALKDIPARGKITPDMVGTATRVSDQVDTDALSDPRAATGKIALITIPAGSILTQSKVAAPAALALPSQLGHGLRAISVAIDKVKGVSGLIEPGDRVDVIAVPPRAGDDTPEAMTILRGILVLAIGTTTETASAGPSPDNSLATTATLAVTPAQADLLSVADVFTTIRLALRSADEPTRAFPVERLAFGAAQPPSAPAAPPPLVAAVPPPVAPAPAPTTGPLYEVQVIQGDQLAPGSPQ
jgi:pilus assembly protein CpaB